MGPKSVAGDHQTGFSPDDWKPQNYKLICTICISMINNSIYNHDACAHMHTCKVRNYKINDWWLWGWTRQALSPYKMIPDIARIVAIHTDGGQLGHIPKPYQSLEHTHTPHSFVSKLRSCRGRVCHGDVGMPVVFVIICNFWHCCPYFLLQLL